MFQQYENFSILLPPAIVIYHGLVHSRWWNFIGNYLVKLNPQNH